MKYSAKVKRCEEVYNAISSLPKDGEIKVLYGKDYNGRPNVYKIRAYEGYKGEMSYSIWKGYSGMNISKIGKTSLNAYSYDMMSQKTTYRFQLSKMQVYKEVEEEVAA